MCKALLESPFILEFGTIQSITWMENWVQKSNGKHKNLKLRKDRLLGYILHCDFVHKKYNFKQICRKLII
jgi:hypothetical protein